MTFRRTTFFLLTAVLSVVLAGCAGSSDKAYEEGMRSVGADITAASRVVADMPADAPTKERADTITRQAEAFKSAAAKAEKLNPPKQVKTANDQLISALRDYAKLLDQMAEVTLKEDSAAQASLLGDAGEIVKRIQEASTDLEKQGYSFGNAQEQE